MRPSRFPSADDRGLSPVMATIFMIGVAVIAVGAVGILVLDIGDGVQDPPPAAAFSFSYTQNDSAGDELLVTHVAGNELPKETIEIQVENVGVECGGHCAGHSPYSERIDWSKIELQDQSAGSTVSLNEIKRHYIENSPYDGHIDPEEIHMDLREATVRIVWKGGSGSVIVDEWTGPDA